jgi:hypothetical protein
MVLVADVHLLHAGLVYASTFGDAALCMVVLVLFVEFLVQDVLAFG